MGKLTNSGESGVFLGRMALRRQHTNSPIPNRAGLRPVAETRGHRDCELRRRAGRGCAAARVGSSRAGAVASDAGAVAARLSETRDEVNVLRDAVIAARHL